MTRILAADTGQVRPGEPVSGVRLVAVTTPGHTALLRTAHGDPDAAIPVGGGAVLAVRGDVVVSTASWTAVVGGTSEIVGVATVALERRRGLGSLVVAAAVRAAAGHGADLVWLRTEDVGAYRLYSSLGFDEAPELAPGATG